MQLVERRAGLAIEELRVRYPRLVLTGGMCNTDTLFIGPAAKVREEGRRMVEEANKARKAKEASGDGK